MRISPSTIFCFVALAAAVGCSASTDGSDPDGQLASASQDIVHGASYTTFDATLGGCLDSKNGVDCNHYVAKEDVYVNGGPAHGTLGNGTYFFAVLVPGHQNGGFLDGAEGNLSDIYAGGTAGDLGSGDDISNRKFTMQNGVLHYTGTHAMGTSPNGKAIVSLFPYDDTSNPGGVYILAVCKWGATSPRDCKYDAFHVRGEEGEGGSGGSSGGSGGAPSGGSAGAPSGGSAGCTGTAGSAGAPETAGAGGTGGSECGGAGTAGSPTTCTSYPAIGNY